MDEIAPKVDVQGHGNPNFLPRLADSCLNPGIASASFKITSRRARSGWQASRLF